MRNQNGRGFVDIGDLCFQHPANVILRASDIDSYRKIVEDADLWEARGERRCVYYESLSTETPASTKVYLELIPYRHPSGAAAITLGTLSTASNGTVSYTPTKEGYLLTETGVAIPNPSLAVNVAGALFADYYYHVDDDLDPYQSHRAITINEGDFLWLIRGGRFYLASSGAVTDGDMLIASTATAGKVESAGALDTASVAAFNTSLQKNTTGDALPAAARGLARARETIGGAGLVKADLLLPFRYSRTH